MTILDAGHRFQIMHAIVDSCLFHMTGMGDAKLH